MLLTPGDDSDIVSSVTGLIGVLECDEVKISERHTPLLYARYLKRSLKKSAPNLTLHVSPPPISPAAYGTTHGDSSTESSAAWTSTEDARAYFPSSGIQAFHGSSPASEVSCDLYFQGNGMEIDFSLPYFMQTVSQPEFAKPSPPPGEVPAEIWWQDAFPVNSAAPASYQWPMTMGMATYSPPTATGQTLDHQRQRQRFSVGN